MSQDARDALNLLIAALEQHFDVVQMEDLASDEALETAEQRLQDAFFTYDDLLYTTFGGELPFDLIDDEDDEDEDEDDDDSDDDVEFVIFEDEDEEHDSA
ncbi:DNA primase [Scrofimicrobium sp. R131]|uniref:DNA primase n=1 Tax=Scrofimicrobium appendicitidis TaxID=3079930 RepID=A0AAU7V5B0_9ACTO